jgi:hypothetical protein
MLKKIISGDDLRPSRLHDEKGNFIGMNRFLSHAPSAILTGLLRLSIDYRPATPWISYSVIRALEKHLTRSSRVLEFGSGMSTIWYAKHAGEVFSVEDYKPWFDKVSKLLEDRKIANITYKIAKDENEYSRFMADDATGFDLIMVDGSHRSACIANATKLLRDGLQKSVP